MNKIIKYIILLVLLYLIYYYLWLDCISGDDSCWCINLIILIFAGIISATALMLHNHNKVKTCVNKHKIFYSIILGAILIFMFYYSTKINKDF
jgi:hypothetical protein